VGIAERGEFSKFGNFSVAKAGRERYGSGEFTEKKGKGESVY